MNLHHTQYPRCTHESHFATRKIRQNHSLIVPMDEEIEAVLHKEVPIIPVLDHYTAMGVVKDFQPTSSHLKSLDNLMRSIDRALERPRTTEIQRSLGQLTIHAIELQIPYLKMGMLTDVVGERL